MKTLSKYLTLFIIFGMVYMCIELLARTVDGCLVGYQGISFMTLAGWTSWWMFLVGGILGVMLGFLNEIKWIKQRKSIGIQVIIGGTLITVVELIAGVVLNIWFGLAVWEYYFLHFLGQICLINSILWYFLCPFAFWLDDAARFYIYSEEKPKSLLIYYASMFTSLFPKRKV